MHIIHGIKVLRSLANMYKLRNAGVLTAYTDTQLSRIYDGLPDSLDACMEPALLIYKVERYLCSVTAATPRYAIERLLRNCRTCISREYAWYNPMRYIARLQASRYVKTCA